MSDKVLGKAPDIVVAVCDDEKLVAQSLTGIVDDILRQRERKCRIIQFYDGTSLLEAIMNIDLVFLDIDLPEHDGIYIGSRIKELNPKCTIIMATGREDRFKDAFKISAFRYITKPFDKMEIYEAIQAYLDTRRGENYVDLFYKRNPMRVKEKEILYIRAMDSYSEVVVQNHVMRTEQSVTSLEQELDPSLFFRIHKQYIVNMSAIQSCNKTSVVIGDKELSISRRKKSEFEKRYLEYAMKCR